MEGSTVSAVTELLVNILIGTFSLATLTWVFVGIDEEIEVIDNMIRKSQMDLLDAGKDEERIQEIGERIVSLRERRQNVLTQAALRKDEIDRIKAMISFIAEQTGEAEYSEALVRSMVEKVTIRDDKITVEFKSGLAIDVEA